MPSRLVKKPFKPGQKTTQYPITTQFWLPNLPISTARSPTIDIFERNLQKICGPGPQYSDYLAQQPHIKYKLFTVVGEQKWRPSNTILTESIMGSEDTSLHWPDFLRFRILQDTTPFHYWKVLYQAQRNGKRPIMRDCYVTAGWDNRSKLPLWLPQSSQEPGTLKQLIETWFPTIKDKISIIFEYIDTDIKTSLPLAPDIPPPKLTANKDLSYTSHSAQFISSSSTLFSSSPPLLSLKTQQPAPLGKRKGTTHKSFVNDCDYPKETSESSSDSSLLSLADLINQVQEIAKASVDDTEVDRHTPTIDIAVPLPHYISESSLSSLPSTPSLPQPQCPSFCSSPPHTFLLSDPLMTTSTSVLAPSPILVPLSQPGPSFLLCVFLANCLCFSCFPAGIHNPLLVYTTRINSAYMYLFSKNYRMMIMRKLLGLLLLHSYDNPR